MFMVEFLYSTDPFNVNFRPVLISILETRTTGIVVNTFDDCIFSLENLYRYEGEDGEWVTVRERS